MLEEGQLGPKCKRTLTPSFCADKATGPFTPVRANFGMLRPLQQSNERPFLVFV
jgi:hypothetical protein